MKQRASRRAVILGRTAALVCAETLLRAMQGVEKKVAKKIYEVAKLVWRPYSVYLAI